MKGHWMRRGEHVPTNTGFLPLVIRYSLPVPAVQKSKAWAGCGGRKGQIGARSEEKEVASLYGLNCVIPKRDVDNLILNI